LPRMGKLDDEEDGDEMQTEILTKKKKLTRSK
jgi:hypothetical protein